MSETERWLIGSVGAIFLVLTGWAITSLLWAGKITSKVDAFKDTANAVSDIQANMLRHSDLQLAVEKMQTEIVESLGAKKLDVTLHEETVKRLDGQLATLALTATSLGHRISNNENSIGIATGLLQQALARGKP